MNRAYGTFEIKSINEEKRIIEGIATTSAVDRDRDTIDTEGLEFKLPLPLLLQHWASEPIGTVETAKVTAKGLLIKCQIAAAEVDREIETVWRKIKAGLFRGFSIGFRPLEHVWNDVRGGYDFKRVEVLEVSVVTIPANMDATITSIKSICLDELSALGTKAHKAVYIDKTQPSGVSEKNKDRNMTIKEQIKSFEATRQAKAARTAELMELAGKEGRTLNAEEAQEYDDVKVELKAIDEHLVRLHEQEKIEIKTATPIRDVTDPELGSKARSGESVVTVKGANVPPGTAFIRYVMAVGRSRGIPSVALAYAKAQAGWKDQTPQIEKIFSDENVYLLTKAPIAPGSTTDPAWAGALVDYNNMASEFIEFLRPQTIIGRLDGFRRVPFNIQMPKQVSSSSSQWVGEGKRKPVSKPGFGTVTLGFAKSASIIVFNDELLRFSNPSIEGIVRQDLAEAMTQFLDEQFINPSVVAVPGTNPASVTNGAAHAAASGTGLLNLDADFKTAVQSFANANITADGFYWIMRPDSAISLSLIRAPFGNLQFPEINGNGGTFYGYPVVPSNSAPERTLIILKPSEILLADDGGVSIDMSKEASIVMESDSEAEGESISMFQNNMVAMRAERFINWLPRRKEAVYYITGADYGADAEG